MLVLKVNFLYYASDTRKVVKLIFDFIYRYSTLKISAFDIMIAWVQELHHTINY